MKNKRFIIPLVLVFAICLTLIPVLQAQRTKTTSTDKKTTSVAVTPGQVYEITEIKMPIANNQMTDFVFLDDNGTERTLRELVLGKNVFLNF